MPDDTRRHRDHYDVSDNAEAQYVDAQKTVLVNKQGIGDIHTLDVAEETALATAYETLFSEVRIDTRLSCDLLRHIHERIFGAMFSWGGRWRTVNISKPGVTWPPPMMIGENMANFERDFLAQFNAETLTNDQMFCEAVAIIQGEFLVVHPFREGNARTIKLATDLLAAQTGRPFLKYDQTDAGRERYILAASRSFARDYRLMTEIIRKALAAAQS